MRNLRMGRTAPALALAGLLALCAPCASGQEGWGDLAVLKGTATVQAEGQKAELLKPGMLPRDLSGGETIKTANGARAHVVPLAGSFLMIEQNSVVAFKKPERAQFRGSRLFWLEDILGDASQHRLELRQGAISFSSCTEPADESPPVRASARPAWNLQVEAGGATAWGTSVSGRVAMPEKTTAEFTVTRGALQVRRGGLLAIVARGCTLRLRAGSCQIRADQDAGALSVLSYVGAVVIVVGAGQEADMKLGPARDKVWVTNCGRGKLHACRWSGGAEAKIAPRRVERFTLSEVRLTREQALRHVRQIVNRLRRREISRMVARVNWGLLLRAIGAAGSEQNESPE